MLKTTEDEKQAAAERKSETDRIERQKYIAQQSLEISSQTLQGIAALSELFAGKSKNRRSARSKFKKQ